jgi:hypothetical protein
MKTARHESARFGRPEHFETCWGIPCGYQPFNRSLRLDGTSAACPRRGVAKAAGDRATYEWQYSKVGEPWIDVEPTRQAKKALNGLAAGTTYRCRIRSVTKAGRSDFGEVVSVLVT